MEHKIAHLLSENISVTQELLHSQIPDIIKLTQTAMETVKNGKKILLFGNGGSASDSLHIAAEFIGRFKKERNAIPAIALTDNCSIITAIGNDYGFDYIFERQIEGIGAKGDLAIGISTSGNSKNVIQGILKAKSMGLKTAALTGKDGGELAKTADLCIKVPSNNTPRIQEIHITIGHIISELIEDA